MADFSIDLEGTPEDVQAMVDKGSRIDGAKAYKKKWINPGLCRVWYRGKRTAPNDLVAAIKRKAGLTKVKARKGKGQEKATDAKKMADELNRAAKSTGLDRDAILQVIESDASTEQP